MKNEAQQNINLRMMVEQKMLMQQKADYYYHANQANPNQIIGAGKEDQKIPN